MNQWRDEDMEIDKMEEIEVLEAEVEVLSKMTMDVLMCYSEIDSEVGYVQGMNSIAAALVYNFWLVRKEQEKFDDLDNFENFDSEESDLKLSRPQRIKRDLELIRRLSNFNLKYNTEEVFYVFCGLLKFSKLRECFGVGLELL